MPKDERQRQKKLLKKKQKKQKANVVSQLRRALSMPQSSPIALIRKAREYPILECWINDNWDKGEGEGLVQILISRQQPDGDIAFGVYLVDMLCLGIKNTFCNAGYSPGRYRSEVVPKAIREARPKKVPPELVHQIIYQAIDYAAQYGFKPQKDYKWSRYILEERGVLEEPYKLTFGKDGKPLFVSGPYDNVDVIIRRLDKYAGPGNYDYLVFADSPHADVMLLREQQDDDEE